MKDKSVQEELLELIRAVNKLTRTVEERSSLPRQDRTYAAALEIQVGVLSGRIIGKSASKGINYEH